MTEPSDFEWLNPDDRRVLHALDGPATGQRRHAPKETLVVRAIIAASAPAWLGITVAVMAMRVATKRKRSRPALVLHQRVGFDSQLIWVPKIATMTISDNRSALAGLVEFASGPPIEGHVAPGLDTWLRRSGFDELPQLALVTAGHMRLVGPRPVTPSEIDEMRRSGPVGIDRVAPGLLGVWQLLDRSAYSLAERRALDQWMLERWGPKLRWRIVRTGLRQVMRRVAGV